ncbi:hypothetical protein [Rubritalea tangerina]
MIVSGGMAASLMADAKDLDITGCARKPGGGGGSSRASCQRG